MGLFPGHVPFLDGDNLLRVGGRLRHAGLSFPAIHQAILPSCHPSYESWVMALHLRHFHAGPSFVLGVIRRTHWPVPDAVRVTRKVIASCVRCRRYNPVLSQRMGDLPAPRVRPAPPFAHTGVDYAGPFLLRRSRSHVVRVEEKVWVAVFVCMVTKAVHVEVADGCSSTEFLDTMARFVARRGFPSHLYSDCGTNFIGADALFHQWASSPELSSQLAEQGVQWHFNPPAAPHFGGLWEAAVKSVKRHPFRAVLSYVFSRSEFTSLLLQIEGCLNSRPLVSLTSGVDCVDVLTPAHFLIGRPLIALPVDEVLKTGSHACVYEV